jgi:hypothetical protein
MNALKQKVFLAYETGGIRADVLREAFGQIFKGEEWEPLYGDLPETGIEADKTFVQVRDRLVDACAVFDLTAEKRPLHNGLNHNVLLEIGLALAMKIPTYAMAYNPILTYKDVHDRVSDLQGCNVYSYATLESLRARLEAAKKYFVDELRKRSKIE